MKYFLPILVLLISTTVMANQYPMPLPGNAYIGKIQYTEASRGDTPAKVAQRFNVGLNAMVMANPGTTEIKLGSASLKIASAFLLPPLPQKGIVINLPEMRLYYYPDNENSVMTFPIGIGKIGNTIPIRDTIVTSKTLNPSWTPGPDIRRFNEEQGIDLPKTLPPGPDNPLGPYAIYLDIPSFLIHSTIFPESVGRRASFGCIRLYESDIKDLYPLVAKGTPVLIVNLPYKAGWNGKKLYFEAHIPMEEHAQSDEAALNKAVQVVQNTLPSHGATIIDWQLIAQLVEEPDGVPHEVGFYIN